MASTNLLSRAFHTRPCSSDPTPSLSLIPRHLLPFRFAASPRRKRKNPLRNRSLVVSFALNESSASPRPVDQEEEEEEKEKELRALLKELEDSFDLPSDFLEKLPRDLRLDLNDAAFDLSNGPVIDECGQDLGEMLLNLARAWEQADTATCCSISNKFTSLESSLTDDAKAALGKRLQSAGRRFTAMGQYGQGELPRIANAMTTTGKLLAATPVCESDGKPKTESRMLKFGNLQIELTPEKAYTGAAIAFVFGILTWGLAQGIQRIPGSSLVYGNENASLLAKSLRGALLTTSYSSTAMSAICSVGLLLYARQLSSESKSKEP